MTTENLIIRLARSAGPVQPLAPPVRRLGRWSIGAIAATVVGATIIGVRPDAGAIARHLPFVALAVVTVVTALVSAAIALVLSVPGAERSAAQRWAPVGIGGFWALILIASLLSGGSALQRVASFPVHVGCVLQILGLALLPGWWLFAMVHRAAPLRHSWSGANATLAAVALAAAGTQFICPIDDPAHLLVGHFVPVVMFALCGAWLGRRLFSNRNRMMPA